MKPIVPVRWLGRVASIASRPLHVIASLKLAVALLVLLAAVLAWATILEATRGREMAQWYVYTSPWFIGLLGLLGGNILAATLIRWPWRTRQVGFVVTHAGLLVLLAGAVQTFQYGIEGQVTLREGDRTDKVLVRDRSLITVERPSGAGRLSSQFAFHPGAVDWREGKTLEFGESQSLALEVLKFYRYARPHIDWVADAQDDQGPALRLALSDGTGQTIAEDWLTASTYGGEVLVGPTRYALLPIPVESMLQDFLQPPTDDLGTAGVLSMHFDGKMYRARIDDQKGKTVPLGDSGVSVEIVDYYADAKPTPNGRQFVARSDKPRNPILELRVHLPGAAEPIRQLAFAKVPLLNLDGVSGHVCPVKFWYHHANIPQTPGADFLADTGRQVVLSPRRRRIVGRARGSCTQSTDSRRHQFEISVVRHLPQARREITFTPLEPGMRPTSTDEAAVLVDLTVDGEHRQLWLSRGDGEFGLQTVFTPQGLVAVTFGYQQLPLGFTIELEKFQRSVNPGRVGDAAFASTVKLLDPALGTELSATISMNEPLTHGKFTFYQSSFQALRGNSPSVRAHGRL